MLGGYQRVHAFSTKLDLELIRQLLGFIQSVHLSKLRIKVQDILFFLSIALTHQMAKVNTNCG